MINRESGVFQTNYEGDMALYTLPLAKTTNWTMLIILVLLPWVVNSHWQAIINASVLASIGAIGLNILVGYTGQISIGQGAFMMIGGYTAAILSSRYELPFWVGIPAGGVVTMLVGVLFGIPSLRVKGLYLAIATLAVQLMVPWVINHVEWISGGAASSIYVSSPDLFGFVFDTELRKYYLILVFFLLAYYGALNLVRSRVGRAFIAVRDRDIAAEIIGVNLFKYKLIAFAISSFYAGVAGALFTYYLRIANYENFELVVSIDYLAMIIIGGLGSVFGSVLGAIFITLFPISLDLIVTSITALMGIEYQSAANFLANLQRLIYGALIIIFLVVEPEGLARLWEYVKRYFRLWPFSY